MEHGLQSKPTTTIMKTLQSKQTLEEVKLQLDKAQTNESLALAAGDWILFSAHKREVHKLRKLAGSLIKEKLKASR